MQVGRSDLLFTVGASGRDGRRGARNVDEIVELLGSGGRLDRRPVGQQQRTRQQLGHYRVVHNQRREAGKFLGETLK